MSKKQKKHHTESSKSHDPRKTHDRTARSHSDDVYANEGRSNTSRYFMLAFAAILAVTLTVLFVGAFIDW